MYASFRKIFFPIEDELKKQQEFIENIQNEDKTYWLSKGLTESEYKSLKELEIQECECLRGFQSYASRRSLLEDNLIILKQVYADIKKYEHKNKFIIK